MPCRDTVASFTPFDPTAKRTVADIIGPDGTAFSVAKGAPQVIAAMCGDEDPVTGVAYNRQVALFAERGDRALGVAERRAGQWQLLGLLPLADPPREDSAETVRAAEGLGVRVKMVTGDALAIGRSIAAEVGIGPDLLDAGRLDERGPDASGGDEAVADLIEQTDGFAQVFPRAQVPHR